MPDQLLAALSAMQHADSMFPNGAVSFSWGLEALYNRGIVAGRADVAEFLLAHVEGRWADFDRPVVAHALAAAGDIDRLVVLDEQVEAQSLGAELRLGSTRMGNAMLNVHLRLKTRMAAEYLDAIADGRAFGHVAVVQGMLWGQLGFGADQAQVMSAHGLCTGILSASIRLSAIGHIDAQAIYAQVMPRIEAVLRAPLCDPEELHSFAPQIEIASMKHETDEMRLFVN
jgi:urease accessory protein